MKRIAITGATGFVGRHACAALAATGREVVAVVRSSSRVPGTVSHRVAALDDKQELSAAFEGVDAVVHLAARVHVMRERAGDSLAEYRRVNVNGTMSAYRAACAAGARRFVFVSSVKVHGEERALPYTDSDEPSPTEPYGISKLEAERALQAARSAGGMADIVILRPPLVYGPGVGGNFRRLLKLADVARRWPLPLGRIPNRRSMVAVRNLADAIRYVLDLSAAADRALLVSDGVDLSTSDMLTRLSAGLGGRARLWPCPLGAIRAAAIALGRRAQAERMLGSLTVDSSTLRAGLGWAPPLTVDAALAEVSRWWRERSEP